MTARQLIDGASFGPDTLKALGQAFDEAWQEVEGNFGGAASVMDGFALPAIGALPSRNAIGEAPPRSGLSR
jgi:hypothetical protein